MRALRALENVKTKEALRNVLQGGGDLPAGSEGTIVYIHEQPQLAYEVEFCDDEGRTTATVPLRPEQLEPA